MIKKTSWFLKLWDDKNPDLAGIGECGPLPGLSAEYNKVERLLKNFVVLINLKKFELPSIEELDDPERVVTFFKFIPSSIAMALETALRDLYFGGKKIIYKNSTFFSRPIPINGLIWMGDREFMVKQIEKKIALGFDCLKLKIGGLDFATELEILSWIRSHYSQKKLTIRLDANGAFQAKEVLKKMEALAVYDIHSLEQPIPPRAPEWPEICRNSPIPIALDESLIEVPLESRESFLDDIRPRFLVLKPSLHNGFSTCKHWIKKAESRNIGWWITSALESAIGLNAIAQFAGTYPLSTYQGLGTGELYADNFESPLYIQEGKLFHDNNGSWN